MIYTVTFLILLVFTASVMGMTVHAGLQKRRRVHLARAITTIVLLAATVLFAYLMSVYERILPEPEMNTHRIFSATITYTVPAVVITGILLWRNPRWRLAHRLCVGVLVLATVCALGTGLWVLYISEARTP